MVTSISPSTEPLPMHPPPPQSHVLQPGEGLELDQVDFTFPGATVLDSEKLELALDSADWWQT